MSEGSPSLVGVASSCAAVVGIDLAGGPSPAQAHQLRDYSRPFSLARDLGLGRTVHAGEGRPPSEIREAILLLHAQRIGHGTTLTDDPAVLDLVRERGVTIEACLTSNLHTGAVDAIEAHPLPRLLRDGVRVTVCTDNTLFSDVDAPGEYRRAAALPGTGATAVEALAAFGHAAAFPRRG
jgi:adenosine deaminase